MRQSEALPGTPGAQITFNSHDSANPAGARVDFLTFTRAVPFSPSSE
jgi:hypothetical protein